MRQKVDFDLFSTITYSNELISADRLKKLSPLSCIIKKNGYKGKFLLVGNASMGKSSNITTLKIHLLKEGKEFYYCNLANLNHEVKTAPEIIPNIVILDSYDEVWKEKKNKAHEFIKKIFNKNPICLIIASRYMPTAIDGFSKEDLEDFIRLDINELAKEQINRYVDKHCGSIKVNSFIKKLFVCPMYLKMFIEMNDKLRVRDIEDEASFISEYFRQMASDKEKVESDAISVKSVELFKAAFDTATKKNYEKELKIQNIYNSIFNQRKTNENKGYVLTASSIRYLNWSASQYIVLEIVNEFNKFRKLNVEELAYLLDYDFEEDNQEILRFAGELLRHVSDKEVIVKALDDEDFKKQDTKWFYNLAISVTVCCDYKIDDNIFGVGDFFLENFYSSLKDFGRRWEFFVAVESGFDEGFKELYLSNKKEEEIYLSDKKIQWEEKYYNNFTNKKYLDEKFFIAIKDALCKNTTKWLIRTVVNGTIYLGDIKNVYKICMGIYDDDADVCLIKNGCKIVNYEGIGASNYKVEVDNSRYKAIDGNLFSKNGDILFHCPKEYIEKYKIPKGTKKIAKTAFFDVEIKELICPSTLQEISKDSFCCAKIEKLTILNGLKEIKQGSFFMADIDKITIPASVNKIEAFAFSDADIRHIKMLDDVENIEGSAFFNCWGLETLDLPSWFNGKGWTFEDCVNLKKITFKKGGEFWFMWEEFLNCKKLKELYISGSALFAEHTFDGCSLEKLYLSKDSWMKYTAEELYERHGLPKTCKVIYK